MLPLIIGGAVVAAAVLYNKKKEEKRRQEEKIKSMREDNCDIGWMYGRGYVRACSSTCSLCGNLIPEHQIVKVNTVYHQSLNLCYECWKSGAKVKFVSEGDPKLKYERKNLLEYKGKLYELSVKIDSEYEFDEQADAKGFLAVLAQRQNCQLIFDLIFLQRETKILCSEVDYDTVECRHKYWKAMGLGYKLIG